MSLRTKQIIIALLGATFLASLLFVQWMEIVRRKQEAGLAPPRITIPVASRSCVECHRSQSPGIVDHWMGSTHAEKGVSCLDCHQANEKDADAYKHQGQWIATIVTPRDCSACHKDIYNQFERSHHAAGGNILASLDNFLAETVEGNRLPFNPHSPTPGMPDVTSVEGMASAIVGCKQCHGSKVALEGTDGSLITMADLKPDPETGLPTNLDAVAKIKRDPSRDYRPYLSSTTWPNTGIGRINLDGSLGSCSACHSRHDFSPRRARQPENCGKCHLGPDHPQKEIYEESKHGVAFRDLKDKMNLDAHKWVLGEDYSQAPTCATCHMSANTKNGRKVTHDPGERISWTNRPPVSLLLDTNINGKIVTEADPAKRAALTADSWQDKRERMKQVCAHCHTQPYTDAFYQQYDDFVILYNEKFAKPGQAIMASLKSNGMLTGPDFDEEIEWVWFYLWHHEGRRARHGASMFAPDYAHWHGMYEVAERFYMQLIPQARELADHAEAAGDKDKADAVRKLIDEILARPEHQWYEKDLKQLKARQAAGKADAAKQAGEANGNGEDGAEKSGGEANAPRNDDPPEETRAVR